MYGRIRKSPLPDCTFAPAEFETPGQWDFVVPEVHEVWMTQLRWESIIIGRRIALRRSSGFGVLA